MEEPIQEKKLSGSQKTGFVLLFIFALLTVGLSFLQIRNNIYNPFALQISQSDFDTLQSLQYDENTKLQQIDTDQDGLTDYEEITFYNTSRYLPDTDSDGLTDYEEIKKGSDPLCPEGETCLADVSATATSTQTGVSPLMADILSPDEILINGQQQLDTSTVETNTSTEIGAVITDPNVLREMLVDTGKVTMEDLQNIDDDTLLQLAKEIFSTQFQDQTTNNSNNSQ
ncbi:MAG: hypothetical protein COX80_03990 [Candidatus Magasanikbacteria bacterium CG_4_10_14_0_2_um_filter_33_14]|uniref:Uncharacterized protein n=1 Tax=Candidatus Magasanikbacteria bacterium CG_4_10_14_0_2_um_filter_33_14 TaxID=1974636 RepID=A0A2M7V9V5_9BACT|nr:MAG: hypothetical protein COX80_03990 [Candidatus Magasanikbacteria bacterium CG_4_10_14_0_2_um_filter_33_14]